MGSKSRRRRVARLVAMLDARARLAWAEVVDDLKSLSVMFAAIRSLNLLNAEYGIRFEAVLTDNGAEAASRGTWRGIPMERLLGELGIKHRCTRPYRLQRTGRRSGSGGRRTRSCWRGRRSRRRRSCVRSWGSTCCTPTRRVRIRDGGQDAPPCPAGLLTNYLTSTGMTKAAPSENGLRAPPISRTRRPSAR